MSLAAVAICDNGKQGAEIREREPSKILILCSISSSAQPTHYQSSSSSPLLSVLITWRKLPCRFVYLVRHIWLNPILNEFVSETDFLYSLGDYIDQSFFWESNYIKFKFLHLFHRLDYCLAFWGSGNVLCLAGIKEIITFLGTTKELL